MQRDHATGARGGRGRFIAVTAIVLMLCTSGIAYLASIVRDDVNALASANAESIQWSLAQIDVELLRLDSALLRAARGPATGLEETRKRFDVFFSRVTTVAQGQRYADLRAEAGVAADIADLQKFLDRYVPVVDGPEQGLRAVLPEMAAATGRLRATARRISLRGVEIFAGESDTRRLQTSETLAWVTSLTIGLVIVLVILVFTLLYLARLIWQRATVQAQTASRLEAIVSTALDAILVVDRSGKIVDYNGAAARIFGYSRDEAIGQKMADLVIPEHLRAAHDAGMRRYHACGEKRVVGQGRVQLEARRKDGSVFPVELSISSAESADGEIFVSYLRDISKRQAARKELEEARDKAVASERAKADLLAVMSHEMRTPLNGLLGAIELIRETALSARQRRYLDIMNTSGQLLLHHVNDVLDISRLDAGKMEISDVPFDANALVAELVNSQRGPANAHSNTLKAGRIDPALSHVQGDPVRLRQVLLNLLGNAIKFTRNGDICVEAERIDATACVEFRVSDTGIGIVAADQQRIFDDFVTLDASYMRSAGGTGLGLGIAKRLTAAMGGTIGVESEPGQGSLFWVRLPLEPCATEPEAPPEEAGLARRAGAGAKAPRCLDILLVEDNRINRVVARALLESEGHRVTEAHDGHEGVALADRTAFDLILMDISMPGMDGVSATQAIRAGPGASCAAPIVALTAHALPCDVQRFADAGMTASLIKPISRKALRDVLAAAAGNGSAAAGTPELAPGRDTANVDRDLLNALAADLGPERLSRLLADFIGDTEDRMTALLDASETGAQPPHCAATVHGLAGAASVFGAVRLRQLLVALETALKTSDLAAVPALQSELGPVWDVTRRELSQLVQQVPRASA